VQVKVEGLDLMMILDTGSAYSFISSADWEKIGKPELKPTQIVLWDTSNKILPLTGQCTISCEYNGQKAKVPVFVYNGQHNPLIGTNWFPQFKFDFNNIFAKITFNQTACKTKPIQSSSSTEKTLVPEKISVPEPDVKEIQEELKLPEIEKKKEKNVWKSGLDVLKNIFKRKQKKDKTKDKKKKDKLKKE
jgi:predicted aspartyl protease